MNRPITICILSLLIFGCTPKNESKPEDTKSTIEKQDTNRLSDNFNELIKGNWRLIKSLSNGKEISDQGVEKIKFYTNNHFYWVTFNRTTKIMRRSMGGRYSFNGEKLTEIIEVTGVGRDELKSLGVTAVIKAKVEADKMYLRFDETEGSLYEEEWERVID